MAQGLRGLRRRTRLPPHGEHLAPTVAETGFSWSRKAEAIFADAALEAFH